MKLKIYVLAASGLISLVGFFLFKNSYNICLSSQNFCPSFFIDFLYPTMFLLGASLFFSFLILIFFELDFLKSVKKTLYSSIVFILISLIIPAQCSAPLGLCVDRKIFIVSYSSLIFIIILIFSVIFFFRNRKNNVSVHN